MSKKHLGLYIEDSEESYRTFQRIFSLYDIELLPFSPLPKDYKDFYDIILEQNVDFVIIDNDLAIQSVKYTGMDVLQFIRSQDPEIYIVYLTNRPFEDKHLSEFDQAVNKKAFVGDKLEETIKRIHRALSRELSIKMEREIEGTLKIQGELMEKQLEYLKENLKEKRDK